MLVDKLRGKEIDTKKIKNRNLRRSIESLVDPETFMFFSKKKKTHTDAGQKSNYEKISGSSYSPGGTGRDHIDHHEYHEANRHSDSK